MTEKKEKTDPKPQRIILHLTNEDHRVIVEAAKEQNRTITRQAEFWILEKVKLRRDSIRKRDFQNTEYE